MALEESQYVGTLDYSNPESDDALSQADDHIRLIKDNLVRTFANMLGAVTASHTDLNKLTGTDTDLVPADIDILTGADAAGVDSDDVANLYNTSGNLQQQIDALSGSNGNLPTGITWNRYSTKDYPAGGVKINVTSGSWTNLGFNLMLWDTDFANKEIQWSLKMDYDNSELIPAVLQDSYLTDANGNALVLEPGNQFQAAATINGNATMSVTVTGTSLVVFNATCKVYVKAI